MLVCHVGENATTFSQVERDKSYGMLPYVAVTVCFIFSDFAIS